MNNAQVFVRVSDLSIRRSAMAQCVNWTPGFPEQAEGRFSRTPRPAKIKRVGRFYTLSAVDAAIAPRSLLHRTRRSAKAFFSGPILVRSQKQMAAIFGK